MSDDSPPDDLAPDADVDVGSPHISRNARVGILADIHVNPDDSDDIRTLLDMAIARFERMDADRIVVVGDLIMETGTAAGDRERIRTVTDALDRSSVPVTYLPGNHDTRTMTSAEFSDAVDQQTAHGMFALTDNVTGIFLDSSAPYRHGPFGHLSGDQLQFVDDALETVSNAVVFVHHPLHYHDLTDNDWFSERPEMGFCQNKSHFTDIVDRHDNVLAVVNGHTHHRYHAEYHGVNHFTVNAANRETRDWDGPTGMHAVLDVSQSRVRMRHYRWSDDHPLADTTISLAAPGAHVALGGTFDPVHDGHRDLFRRAFQFGDLTVGLTSDDLAPKTRHEPRFILPFEERKATLEAVLGEMSHRHSREYDVQCLDSPTGIAAESDRITHLIVTPETVGRAVDINEERRDAGLDPLTIEVVEPIAADGERISSTRICRGEIDPHGNLTPNANGRAPLPGVRDGEVDDS